MNNLYWSIRRELWENRSIYLGPLAVGAVVLFGFFLSLVKRAGGTTLQQVVVHGHGDETPYVVSAIVLMGIQLVIAVIYSLDALYGERRDRSVLFWKSMPVSDRTAVLAKAIIPMLVLPILTWMTTVVTQDVMLVINGVAGQGVPADLSFASISSIHFWHLVVFHGLWYAPLYAWLLLVSAWATRVPFLWAVLPPAAIAIVERIAFNTNVVGRLMQWLFMGSNEPMTGGPVHMTMATLMPHGMDLLFDPGLWIRLAIAAALLFGAVRLRRSRGVI